ncbi:hypothetical protein L3X38_023919 [Prunus dulcis]|uniref:BED-type domain-containing protein n=1 Tax=Prunus dulcis TaxID=3755 RepID=A0AAD4Z4Y6_PRUDU|nr:hypothetical protein L3X38_023919 [Prunus dulcis]
MESSQSNTLNASIRGKRKPNKSMVWDHCTKIRKKDDTRFERIIGVCNYCKVEMPVNPKRNGTTGLKTHLERRCKVSFIYEKGNANQSILAQGEASSALVPHTFNQVRSEMKCVKYIIKDEIPFRAVEGTRFREFIYDLQSRFMIPNRKKVAKGV